MYLERNEVGSFELAKNLLDAIVGAKRESLIDLCCCHGSLTCRLGFTERKYVDIIDRKLDDPNHQKDFIQTDVLGDHPIFDEHYSVAMCLDGIEHLKKDQGWQLIERMKSLADISIVFTPSDAWMMESEESERYHNDPESHKSLWSPGELEGWAGVLFPNYHSTYDIGAFFSWYHEGVDMEEDFERVKGIMNW